MKEISYTGSRMGKQEGVRVSDLSTIPRPPKLMRTLRSDISNRIEETQNADIPMTSSDVSVSQEEGHHFGKIIFILFVVLAFGIGLGMYVLIGTKKPAPALVVETPLTESTLEVQIDNSPREQVLADISIALGKTKLAPGSTQELTFLGKNADGSTRRATTAEILTKISISSPPAPFLRSLSAVPFYGFYASKSGLSGYFLFRSRSYPNTFSAILEWEGNMARDLIPSLNPWSGKKDIANMRGKLFIDERLAGIDTRVLRNNEGAPLIAYAFINKKTLIITTTDEGLVALITKLNSDEVLVLP